MLLCWPKIKDMLVISVWFTVAMGPVLCPPLGAVMVLVWGPLLN